MSLIQYGVAVVRPSDEVAIYKGQLRLSSCIGEPKKGVCDMCDNDGYTFKVTIKDEYLNLCSVCHQAVREI